MPDVLAIETGIYLLTPTHCGTGQASGAIDLPIARERHTDHPLLPATALKGVARQRADRLMPAQPGDNKSPVDRLFGPEPPGAGKDPERLLAGSLVFTDGRLLAFPVRSLQAAFFWITCPMIIQRWQRTRMAGGLPGLKQPIETTRASATFGMEGGLVLEDLYLPFGDVLPEDKPLKAVAKIWSGLIPPAGTDVQKELETHLVCVPNPEFGDLVRRCTPVNARVQLTGGKTTDKWENPETGREETGNLWYEETLPSDCLFSALVMTRDRKPEDLQALKQMLLKENLFQMGGNETVGQGQCWWHVQGEVGNG